MRMIRQNDFSKYQTVALFQIKLKEIIEENYVFLISLIMRFFRKCIDAFSKRNCTFLNETAYSLFHIN